MYLYDIHNTHMYVEMCVTCYGCVRTNATFLLKFMHSSRMPVKLTTLVDFPLYGFDMTPHLAPGYRESSPPSLWSPWRRPSVCKQSSKRDSNAYDLYAVCNHHGQDLQNGHYTGSHIKRQYMFSVVSSNI